MQYAMARRKILRLDRRFVDLGISLTSSQNACLYFQRASQYISVSCVTRARSRFPFLPRMREIAAPLCCCYWYGYPAVHAAVDFSFFLFIYSPFLTFHRTCIFVRCTDI